MEHKSRETEFGNFNHFLRSFLPCVKRPIPDLELLDLVDLFPLD